MAIADAISNGTVSNENYWRYSLVAPRVVERESLELNMAELADDEVFGTTLYSAISPGTEGAAFTGMSPLRPTASPYPRLLGYMNVARIEAIGSGCKSYKVGDLVYSHISHQNAFVTPEASILAKLPVGCAPARAAPAYLYRLGWNALRRGQFKPGMSVAIIGLGAIGLATVDLATTLGAKCYGISGHELAIAAAEKMDGIALSKSAAREKYSGDTKRFGGLADICIITTNSWSDFRLAAELTKFNGVISVLGFPGRDQPRPEFNPLDSTYFYDRQQSIVAAGFGPEQLCSGTEDAGLLKSDMQAILGMINDAKLSPEILTGKTFDAAELSQALEILTAPRDFCGTIILDWQ